MAMRVTLSKDQWRTAVTLRGPGDGSANAVSVASAAAMSVARMPLARDVPDAAVRLNDLVYSVGHVRGFDLHGPMTAPGRFRPAGRGGVLVRVFEGAPYQQQ